MSSAAGSIDKSRLAAPLRDVPTERLHWLRTPALSPPLDVDGDREFWCDECGRRCTRGQDGTEYGHRRHADRYGEPCPVRPDLSTRSGGWPEGKPRE